MSAAPTLREAAQMALEMLEISRNAFEAWGNGTVKIDQAFDALTAALAAHDETVAILAVSPNVVTIGWMPGYVAKHNDKLYATPQPLAPVAQPAGWKLVPICLTPDMRVELLNSAGLATAELYTMLLSAAPNPPIAQPLQPPAPVEPAKRPENCGTGFCSCIECLFDAPAKPLTQDVVWKHWTESVDKAERTGQVAAMLFSRVIEAAHGIGGGDVDAHGIQGAKS